MQKRPGSISQSEFGLCFRPPGTHAVRRDETVVGTGGWGCKGAVLQRSCVECHAEPRGHDSCGCNRSDLVAWIIPKDVLSLCFSTPGIT